MGRVCVVVLTALFALAMGAAMAAAVGTEKAEDACGLLTRAEIKRAFDQRVGRPKRSLPKEVRDQECAWTLGRSGSPGAGSVRTSFFRGSVATNNYAGVRPHGRALEGLGDGAVYVFEPNLCCAVHVLEGKMMITVQGVFPGDPGIARDPAFEATLRRLAKRAVSRL